MQIPYQTIFPDAHEPVMIVSLARKLGKIPKGEYAFLELYCTEAGCDCRRVCIMVLKGTDTKAVINFGFHPDEELAGPFLNDMSRQSAAAGDLLNYFVDQVNDNPDWVKGMHERYRKVRAKIDGRKYRGKPFPLPGSVVRSIRQPPPMDDLLREFSRLVGGAGPAGLEHENVDAKPPVSVAELVERLSREHARTVASMDEWDAMVRTNFLREPRRVEELTELLPRIIPRNGREEERLMTALQLLRTVLDLMRHELECQRPGAGMRFQQLQASLARNVYAPSGDLALSSQVTRVLLETRVEILPLLREASQAQLFKLGDSSTPSRIPTIGPSLGTLLRKSGCRSPFEGVDNLLDLLLLLDPEIQIGLFGELLNSGDSFVRDTAALMIFHPTKEVREGVAALLASGTVREITSETLRRLIISRNWFPAGMRKQLDEVISAARRGGVVCARLTTPPDSVIKASTLDGAGAQSFFIVCSDKKRKTVANILWKQGGGVIDSFVSQPNKRELESIFAGMPNMIFLETAPEYLDLTVNHALAVGIARERPPHLGLLQVAEAVGSDRWKAEFLDPVVELAALREELELTAPHLLTPEERGRSLSASSMWPENELFADTWFEDDVAVDEVILRLSKGKRRVKEVLLEQGVLKEVLEPRRGEWLERLTLATLWLRAALEPPVPWRRMFHAAEALAQGKPLQEHPLMDAIAEVTVALAQGRAAARGKNG